MKLTEAGKLAKDAALKWIDEKVPMHAAALSYYAIFSMAPLLVIGIGIAGLIFGQQQATEQTFSQLKNSVGEGSAGAIQQAVQSAASSRGGSIFSIVIGGVLLLIGATGAFSQLHDSMNMIWDVKPKEHQGIWAFIRTRLLLFLMVLAVGLVLLLLLVVSAAISGLHNLIGHGILASPYLWRPVDFIVSFFLLAAVFAAVYKWVPDVLISWKDVWTGAFITAFLFALGKLAIGLYLGHSSVSSSYGAAGSLVAVLLWIYYSALIFYFGAEFTNVYARQRGRGIVPTKYAQWEHPQQQGGVQPA